MKLCVDCKHFVREWNLFPFRFPDKLGKCGRRIGISPVTGRAEKDMLPFASTARLHGMACGESGKLWELK